MSAPTPAPTLDPATTVGPVSLLARDRAGLVRWYQRALGLAVLADSDRATVLGTADGRPLVTVVGEPGAELALRKQSGLYHVAILLPSRGDLGRWLMHAQEAGLRLQGAADHLVSEAVYLADPEGNGIEVYRDRPPGEWPRVNGRIHMDNGPFDVEGIVGQAESEARPFDGIPAGTTVGHVHLKIRNVEEARRFYVDVLGFEPTEEGYPSALFVSAGGYHHHVGLNSWESAGRDRIPGTTGLDAATVVVPDGARAAVVARLEASGVKVESRGGDPAVIDPSGNRVVLLEGPVDAGKALAAAGA